MRFRLQETQGGVTVFDEEAGECYKSRHSALAEAEHVFFRPGVIENWWYPTAAPFRILELGFGLGTNFEFLRRQNAHLHLTTIDRDLAGARFLLEAEANPALCAILESRRYEEGSFAAQLLEEDFFLALPRLIGSGEKFHCVYFDPFSPKANPDAWTERLFRLATDLLEPNGRLVTYSVSRAAKDGAALAGLKVEKRDLPPELQKRSSLLAIKPQA
jgi:tRNA U34 5-methylaminomethyl-2-thiouridine-forming methyltransferase MnmC